MNFKEYQELAQRTANKELSKKDRLAIAGLGVSGEAGEIADIIKKHVGHDHPLNEQELSKEIGDVLWYLVELSSVLGVSLEVLAEQNIEKLRRRYPEGFSSERSINREE